MTAQTDDVNTASSIAHLVTSDDPWGAKPLPSEAVARFDRGLTEIADEYRQSLAALEDDRADAVVGDYLHVDALEKVLSAARERGFNLAALTDLTDDYSPFYRHQRIAEVLATPGLAPGDIDTLDNCRAAIAVKLDQWKLDRALAEVYGRRPVSDYHVGTVVEVALRRGWTKEAIGQFVENFWNGGKTARKPTEITDGHERAQLVYVLATATNVDTRDKILAAWRPAEELVAAPLKPGSLAAQAFERLQSTDKAATGARPDFMDTRRPEGKRIMLRKPAGCVHLWIGKWGAHKTGVAIAEAIEAAALGQRVLYIAAEDNDGVRGERLTAAYEARGTDAATKSRLMVWDGTGLNVTKKKQLAALVEALDGYFAPKLIFIDVLGKAVGNIDLSGSIAGTSVMNALTWLATTFKATVVALAHPKAGATGNDLSPFGSSLQDDFADVILSIHNDKGDVRVHATKMKNGSAAGFDVYMRNASKGIPVIVDAKEPAKVEDPKAPWPEPAALETAKPRVDVDRPDDLHGQVVAACAAIVGPHSVPAVVEEMTGEDETTPAGYALGKRLRRRMKSGSLADLALRGDDGKLVKPYAFR